MSGPIFSETKTPHPLFKGDNVVESTWQKTSFFWAREQMRFQVGSDGGSKVQVFTQTAFEHFLNLFGYEVGSIKEWDMKNLPTGTDNLRTWLNKELSHINNITATSDRKIIVLGDKITTNINKIWNQTSSKLSKPASSPRVQLKAPTKASPVASTNSTITNQTAKPPVSEATKPVSSEAEKVVIASASVSTTPPIITPPLISEDSESNSFEADTSSSSETAKPNIASPIIVSPLDPSEATESDSFDADTSPSSDTASSSDSEVAELESFEVVKPAASAESSDSKTVTIAPLTPSITTINELTNPLLKTANPSIPAVSPKLTDVKQKIESFAPQSLSPSKHPEPKIGLTTPNPDITPAKAQTPIKETNYQAPSYKAVGKMRPPRSRRFPTLRYIPGQKKVDTLAIDQPPFESSLGGGKAKEYHSRLQTLSLQTQNPVTKQSIQELQSTLTQESTRSVSLLNTQALQTRQNTLAVIGQELAVLELRELVGATSPKELALSNQLTGWLKGKVLATPANQNVVIFTKNEIGIFTNIMQVAQRDFPEHALFLSNLEKDFTLNLGEFLKNSLANRNSETFSADFDIQAPNVINQFIEGLATIKMLFESADKPLPQSNAKSHLASNSVLRLEGGKALIEEGEIPSALQKAFLDVLTVSQKTESSKSIVQVAVVQARLNGELTEWAEGRSDSLPSLNKFSNILGHILDNPNLPPALGKKLLNMQTELEHIGESVKTRKENVIDLEKAINIVILDHKSTIQHVLERRELVGTTSPKEIALSNQLTGWLKGKVLATPANQNVVIFTKNEIGIFINIMQDAQRIFPEHALFLSNLEKDFSLNLGEFLKNSLANRNSENFSADFDIQAPNVINQFIEGLATIKTLYESANKPLPQSSVLRLEGGKALVEEGEIPSSLQKAFLDTLTASQKTESAPQMEFDVKKYNFANPGDDELSPTSLLELNLTFNKNLSNEQKQALYSEFNNQIKKGEEEASRINSELLKLMDDPVAREYLPKEKWVGALRQSLEKDVSVELLDPKKEKAPSSKELKAIEDAVKAKVETAEAYKTQYKKDLQEFVEAAKQYDTALAQAQESVTLLLLRDPPENEAANKLQDTINTINLNNSKTSVSKDGLASYTHQLLASNLKLDIAELSALASNKAFTKQQSTIGTPQYEEAFKEIIAPQLKILEKIAAPLSEAKNVLEELQDSGLVFSEDWLKDFNSSINSRLEEIASLQKGYYSGWLSATPTEFKNLPLSSIPKYLQAVTEFSNKMDDKTIQKLEELDTIVKTYNDYASSLVKAENLKRTILNDIENLLAETPFGEKPQITELENILNNLTENIESAQQKYEEGAKAKIYGRPLKASMFYKNSNTYINTAKSAQASLDEIVTTVAAERTKIMELEEVRSDVEALREGLQQANEAVSEGNSSRLGDVFNYMNEVAFSLKSTVDKLTTKKPHKLSEEELQEWMDKENDLTKKTNALIGEIAGINVGKVTEQDLEGVQASLDEVIEQVENG